MWKVIFPKLKKLAIFSLSHWTYILWFLLYFTGSFLILSSNRFINYGEAFITCVVLYTLSIATALIFGEQIQKLLNGVRHLRPAERRNICYLYLIAFMRTRKHFIQTCRVSRFLLLIAYQLMPVQLENIQ